jgi:hypothetical protein
VTPHKPDQDPCALVADALALARTRGLSGWHRVVLADAGSVERRVRSAESTRAAVIYHLRLRPWLARGGNPLQVLYLYRMLVREAHPGALALVRDADALYEPAMARWRADPLAARVVRRVLIGSRLPTVWCAPSLASLGPELLAQAPVLQPDWQRDDAPPAALDHTASVDPESLDEDFLVWARTG